ncbi:DUF2510 domain-containing protein [Microbacterium sp. 3H14]|uniref:DUF2510 domain-containing protein n=1 Tax=unclassified Microbacterium TaxID=2609290 RepID=UPI00106AD629|nr:DUF2510 domain-containing protein [Microbacterium sp. 3H14]TFB15424.1 DUF2510 domain-containing protein [Microbacterium sp. 3H14]
MTTTPAGWYDDGSGRQRWWDGQQWTEHFAPEAAAPVEPEAPAAAETPSAPEVPASEVPEYGSPAQPAAGYPGSAPNYPAGYTTSPSGYPAASPYTQPGQDAPKKISILGLVGLGLAAVGTILAFIPVIGFFGFILLGAGFIVSLISLFLKGKKWPGIAGLILAVVGTIIGVVMFLVFVFAVAQTASEELDNLPSTSPSSEATDPGETDGADDGTRPTTPEVAAGLTAILMLDGTEGYTEEQVLCLADLLVVSDLDNATLRAIAESDGTLTDLDAINGLAEVLGDTEAITACFVS